MTEMMMNDTGGEQASEMLDEVFAEPSGPEGMEGEGVAAHGEDGAEAASRTVPLATFLCMRDEAKAMSAENAELRHVIAMMQQPQGQQPDMPPPGLPDPATDPEGYAQHMAMLEHQAMQAEVQQAHEQLSFVETSLDTARSHLGEAEFHEAYETARANPEVAKEVLLHPHPGEALVMLHQQIRHHKHAAQHAAMAQSHWAPYEAAHQPQMWPGAASYRQARMPAPLPSLAGARGGNASALAPLISDDPIDDLLK